MAAVDPHGSTAGMVLLSLTLIPPLVYVNAKTSALDERFSRSQAALETGKPTQPIAVPCPQTCRVSLKFSYFRRHVPTHCSRLGPDIYL